MRSSKKGVFTDEQLVEKIVAEKLNVEPQNKIQINTQKRNITIVPEMVGCLFGIHDGKRYQPKRILNDMIGSKLGTLVCTRKVKIFSSKKNKITVKNKKNKK